MHEHTDRERRYQRVKRYVDGRHSQVSEGVLCHLCFYVAYTHGSGGVLVVVVVVDRVVVVVV